MVKTELDFLKKRRMLYPPFCSHEEWKSKSGLEKKQWPQPPEVISRIVEAFTGEGGAPAELCGLLNEAVPAGGYITDPERLRSGRFHYSLEYYFYIIMYTKYLLDDIGFRYIIDEDTQLDIHHYIFEQGSMKFPPWISSQLKENKAYLSISNIRCFFDYVEHEFIPPPADESENKQVGTEITETVMKFMNLHVPEKYKVERDFFERVGGLISLEYIIYAACFFEVLTNDTKFNFNSLYYGFKHSSIIAEAVFMYSGASVTEGFMLWQERTNNLYNYEIKQRRSSMELKFDLSGLLNSGMCGLYEKISIEKCMQGNPLVAKAFVEHATGLPVKVRLYPKRKEDNFFKVRLNWRNLRLIKKSIFRTAASAVILAVLFFTIIRIFPDRTAFCLNMILSIFCLAGYSQYSVKKETELSMVNKQSAKSKKLIDSQLDSLEKSSEELIRERDSLEVKVSERTEELNAALEQLKQLDRSKTNFIANVSHELRTPLTLLSVPLEGIRSGRYGDVLTPEDQIFGVMDRNLKRLNNQVNQLLDFSRLDLGKMPFSPEPVELTAYCRFLAAEIESLALKKGLDLRFENRSGADRIYISADGNLLETAMLNLLNNALKFTEEGGIKIVLASASEKDIVQLSVEDSGIGFPQDDKGRLFRRFTQAEENRGRHRDGAGLGLALVNEIADKHGWKLDAQANTGGGSCFSLFIPAADSEPAAYSAENSTDSDTVLRRERAGNGLFHIENSSRQSFSEEKDNILLVEDNPDMGAVLEDLIGREYNLYWFSDAQTAIDWLNTTPLLSLIICDVMMQGMDGYGFREKLMDKADYRNLPFIYLTALADPLEKIEGLKTGAVDYIRKPFAAAELMLKIQNLIDTHKASYSQALRDRTGVERLNRIENESSGPIRFSEWNSFGITEAEKRVIELVRRGLQDKEIAAELDISPRTVSSHLGHIYQKTDTQNRVELINLLFSVK